MRTLPILMLLSAIAAVQLSASEVAHPKVEAILADHQRDLDEHAAKLAQAMAEAEQDYRRDVERDRSRALRDLKRLVSSRSDIAEQAQVNRAVLQLDREDREARAFFDAIGTLDAELAALGEVSASEPKPVGGVDLMAASVASLAAPLVASPVAEWQRTGRMWVDSSNYPGLLMASANVPIRFEIAVPGGPCYLHLRYTARQSRPMSLSIDGTLVEEAVVGGTTGGWQLPTLGWETVGPLTLPAGTVLFELLRPDASPHFRGAVISRSPEPPATDPFAQEPQP